MKPIYANAEGSQLAGMEYWLSSTVSVRSQLETPERERKLDSLLIYTQTNQLTKVREEST